MTTKTKRKAKTPTYAAEENKEDVRRLIGLCIELDREMDGVRCPAAAAAILNAIRGILNKYQ